MKQIINTKEERSKPRLFRTDENKGRQCIDNNWQRQRQKGKIVRVLVKENKVIVEGINMMKNTSVQKVQRKGSVKSIEMPIHASNVKKNSLKYMTHKP